jgi:hypothetical protein
MKRRLLDIVTKLLLLVAVLCGAAACKASGSFCSIAPQLYYRQPVYNAMNDREAENTLTYQKTGERLCGWRP